MILLIMLEEEATSQNYPNMATSLTAYVAGCGSQLSHLYCSGEVKLFTQ